MEWSYGLWEQGAVERPKQLAAVGCLPRSCGLPGGIGFWSRMGGGKLRLCEQLGAGGWVVVGWEQVTTWD